MARTPAQRSGDAAEGRALQHLSAAGLQLVTRNWRCRYGEIDLVMRDGPHLVFVEVRRRRRAHGSRFATAAETVGPRKRARLIRTARTFLASMREPPGCRFDVVAIDEDPSGQEQLQWIRDAFTAD